LLVSSDNGLPNTPEEKGNIEVFDPERPTFTSGALSQPHGSGVSATILKDGRVLVARGFERTNAEVLDRATMTY
jgi:hypothetical protein